MTTVHALEQNLLEQIITHDNLTRAWKRVKANVEADRTVLACRCHH